jgi:hypothetical protein
MMIGLRLFISSMIFSITIAVAYWHFSGEIAGTVLLGFMAAALSVVAGYMIFAERDADLWGDDKDADISDAAGEALDVYTTRSPLPFWAALALGNGALGLIVSPSFAVLALIATLGLGAAFILENR